MKTCSWAGVQQHGNESCFMQDWSVKLRKLKCSGQPVPRRGDTLGFWVSGTKINYRCHMEGMYLRRSQLFPGINGKPIFYNRYDALLKLKTFILKWDITPFEQYDCCITPIRPQYLLLWNKLPFGAVYLKLGPLQRM